MALSAKTFALQHLDGRQLALSVPIRDRPVTFGKQPRGGFRLHASAYNSQPVQNSLALSPYRRVGSVTRSRIHSGSTATDTTSVNAASPLTSASSDGSPRTVEGNGATNGVVSTADGAEASESEDVGEVLRVVTSRVVDRKTEYLIEWADDHPDSWEPAENIAGDLLAAFEGPWWTAARKADQAALEVRERRGGTSGSRFQMVFLWVVIDFS